jgi:hypothetical protein
LRDSEDQELVFQNVQWYGEKNDQDSEIDEASKKRKAKNDDNSSSKYFKS